MTRFGVRRSRGRGLGLACGLLLASLATSCGPGGPADRESLNPVIVVFAEGLSVSAAADGFSVEAQPGARVAADAATLAALNARIGREKVIRIATVFPPGAESAEHADVMKRIWSITLAPGTSDAAAEALASDLAGNALVERAYVQPTPEDASGGFEPGPPAD